MSVPQEMVEQVVELRAKGLGPTTIARRLGITKKQAAYVIAERRKSDPEFARACEERPLARGHKEPKMNDRARKSVRRQLDEGVTAQVIAQNTLTSYDYVRRVEAAGKTGLTVEEVPTTWAGAFRKLAEFVQPRCPEAFEYAKALAEAKDVTL